MLWLCRWRSRCVHGRSQHKISTDVWLKQNNMLWDVYHTHRVPQKKEPVLNLSNLISFQNSFTSKKRTKFSIKFTRFFASHPKMYPHYLRKVRSLNLFQSAIDWLKMYRCESYLTKMKLIKVAGQLKKYWHVCLKCPPFAATDTTAWPRCRSRRFHLSQLIHILDFAAPYLVIDRVEVWTVWRPQ